MNATKPPNWCRAKGHTRPRNPRKKMLTKILNLKLKLKTYLCDLCMDLETIWNSVKWCKYKQNKWSQLGRPIVVAEQFLCGSRGAKKRPVEGQDMNALVYSAVSDILKQKKRAKAMAMHKYRSEDETENSNFKNISIRKEREEISGKWRNTSEVQGNIMEEKNLNPISFLVNQTKKGENIHHLPVLYGKMNGIFDKSKFYSLRILLDSGASSYIVLVKHTKN